MFTRPASAILISIAVLLGFGATGASAFPSGTYKGQTKGEVEVKVKVKNNRIKKFETSVYAGCYSYSGLQTFAFPPAGHKGATIKIKNDGSFRKVFTGSPDVSPNDDKRTLTGKFKGSKVSGSVKIEGLCSGETTFKARK